MALQTVNPALRAGPRQLSVPWFLANIVGRELRKASTTCLESERFARRSSGAGMKSSLRSLTTIICGVVRVDFRL